MLPFDEAWTGTIIHRRSDTLPRKRMTRNTPSRACGLANVPPSRHLCTSTRPLPDQLDALRPLRAEDEGRATEGIDRAAAAARRPSWPVRKSTGGGAIRHQHPPRTVSATIRASTASAALARRDLPQARQGRRSFPAALQGRDHGAAPAVEGANSIETLRRFSCDHGPARPGPWVVVGESRCRSVRKSL